FPLGNIASKDDVREMVKDAHLLNAKTKDSQEICFVEENNYVRFIEDHYGYESIQGDFIDEKGNVLGRHNGIINYTIGQRKGLGIALGQPAYVTKINSQDNTVTLGKNEDLFKHIVYSKDNHFINSNGFVPNKLQAKIRYSAKPSSASIKTENKLIKTTFEAPQRAITSGQSIVFYSEEILLGGGIII
ncbi:MAG: tRNA 2-thiouridine(34) synthase MnmA, partial [Clostridia bacterium]|nr:tRNA 2-thiouridine(34) synthase MnmA [Clostridia bacterium]